MIEVPLTQGFTATIDDCDGDFVLSHKWHCKRRSNTCYAGTNIKIAGRYRWRSMHRLILDPPARMVVDHIDGNGLNNQRSNLRICTQAENMRNRRGFGRSEFLGVFFKQGSHSYPWVATCGSTYIGAYATEIEAAAAYDLCAKQRYGSFANLNFSELERPSVERCPSRRKLTDEDAMAIIASSDKTACLAKKYNVTVHMINSIRRGAAYKHLHAPEFQEKAANS